MLLQRVSGLEADLARLHLRDNQPLPAKRPEPEALAVEPQKQLRPKHGCNSEHDAKLEVVEAKLRESQEKCEEQEKEIEALRQKVAKQERENDCCSDIAEVSGAGEFSFPSAPAQREVVPDPTKSKWSSVVRCPSRNGSTYSWTSWWKASSGQTSAANLQTVCWHVLSLVPNVIALLCVRKTLQILDASKKACAIWGTAALHGQSFITLVSSPSRAKWLQFKVTEVHQDRRLHGLSVKDLQCMELQTKGSGNFDSSVTLAHLPNDQACGNNDRVLVIVEALSEAIDIRLHDWIPETAERTGSEVSVSPSDSVSCIEEKMGRPRA